jgi:8-amino-7-oxononanoate synthase
MPWNLQSQLDALDARHLRRRLRSVASPQGISVNVDGRELINFSSNDYLGLANDERLKHAFIDGVNRYGAGSGAARLVCGGIQPHQVFEEQLAQFKQTEAALTFSSGFAAAIGTIPALVGTEDVVILDKLCHASLVDAARLSGATIRVFPHNHLGKLEKLLQSTQGKRVLVVTESIFSMDGDAAALREIVELKDKHGAWLMLDEAHAVGVLGPQGRGLAAALGLDQHIDIHMGTMSKALGLSGGYIAAKREVIDLLINKARSFIYSTAPPPAITHAACESLRIIASVEGDVLRTRLHANIAAAKVVQGFSPHHQAQTENSSSQTATLSRAEAHDYFPAAILPLIIGDEDAAMQLSARLFNEGLLVPAIRYPTVARGSARLRLTLSAAHQSEHIERLRHALAS